MPDRNISPIERNYFIENSRRLGLEDRIQVLEDSGVKRFMIGGYQVYIPPEFIPSEFEPLKSTLKDYRKLITQIFTTNGSIIDPRPGREVVRVISLENHESLQTSNIPKTVVVKNSHLAGNSGYDITDGLNQLKVRSLYQQKLKEFKIKSIRVVDIYGVIAPKDNSGDRQIMEYIEGYDLNQYFDSEIAQSDDNLNIIQGSKLLIVEIATMLKNQLSEYTDIVNNRSGKENQSFKEIRFLEIMQININEIKEQLEIADQIFNKFVIKQDVSKVDLDRMFFLFQKVFVNDETLNRGAISEIGKSGFLRNDNLPVKNDQIDLGNIMWSRTERKFVIIDPTYIK